MPWLWGVRERKRYTPKRTDVGVTLNCSVVTRAATMGVSLVVAESGRKVEFEADPQREIIAF